MWVDSALDASLLFVFPPSRIFAFAALSTRLASGLLRVLWESSSVRPHVQCEPPSASKKDIKVGGIGRAQFIMDNPGLDILEQYDMSRDKLGEGSYGAVYKATKKDTRCARAIKTVSKAQVTH